MTRLCGFCGTFESENTTMHATLDICYDCIGLLTDDDQVSDDEVIRLMENEEERRGLESQERSFRQYWGGFVTSEDRDRQDLRDAGRGHLA